MTKQRASIGFSSSLEELDPAEWKPKPEQKREKKPVRRDDIHKVAKSVGFNSREAPAAVEEPPSPEPAKPIPTGRKFQTGRNNQMNLKVRTEDKNDFYEICDNLNWVQGYAFQRALEALKRELKKAGPEASQTGDRL